MIEIRVSKIRVSEIRVSEIRVSEIRVSEIRISSNHRELHGAIFLRPMIHEPSLTRTARTVSTKLINSACWDTDHSLTARV